VKAKTLYIAARLEGTSADQETLLGTCALFKKYGTKAKTHVLVINGTKGSETVENKMSSSGSGPESAGIGIYLIGHGTSTTGFAHYSATDLANLLINKVLIDAEHEKAQIRKICLLSCMAGYVKQVEGDPSYLKDFVTALKDVHAIRPMIAGFGHWISIGFPLSWTENRAQTFPCEALKSLTSWENIDGSLDYKIESKLKNPTPKGPQNTPYNDAKRLENKGKKLIKPRQKIRYVRPPNADDDAVAEADEANSATKQLKKVVYVFDISRNEVIISSDGWSDKERFLST
jgi:peptidase C80-like protein